MDVRKMRRELFTSTIKNLDAALALVNIEPPQGSERTTPFGEGIASFEQWIKFVFLPRAKEMIANEEDLPQESLLGEAAARTIEYFDEHPVYRRVAEYLRRIDHLCRGEIEEVLLSQLEEGFAKKGTPSEETAAFVRSVREDIESQTREEAIEMIQRLLGKI